MFQDTTSIAEQALHAAVKPNALKTYAESLYSNRLRLAGVRAIGIINRQLTSTRLIGRTDNGKAETYAKIEIARKGKDILVMQNGFPTWVFVGNYDGISTVLLKVSVRQYVDTTPFVANVARVGVRSDNRKDEIKLHSEYVAFMGTSFDAIHLWQYDSKSEKFGQAKQPTTPLDYAAIDELIEKMVNSLAEGKQDSHEISEFWVESLSNYSLSTRFQYAKAIDSGKRVTFAMSYDEYTEKRDSLIDLAKAQSSAMFNTAKSDKFIVKYDVKLSSAIVSIK